MHAVLDQKLTATENDDLGRSGKVWLCSGGRLIQPTAIARPGAEALAPQAASDLNRILLDGVSGIRNPAPIVYPPSGLSTFIIAQGVGYARFAVLGRKRETDAREA